MKKYTLEPHHRRPRSLGGKTTLANISQVMGDIHDFWHYIFGNMNAFQIANRINQLHERKPYKLKVECKFINGSQVEKWGGQNSKNTSLVLKSWDNIFRGMNFIEAIEYINNVFLDPAYHFYVIETEEKEKTNNISIDSVYSLPDKEKKDSKELSMNGNILERCFYKTLKKFNRKQRKWRVILKKCKESRRKEPRFKK